MSVFNRLQLLKLFVDTKDGYYERTIGSGKLLLGCLLSALDIFFCWSSDMESLNYKSINMSAN